jgi:hypothetical protein
VNTLRKSQGVPFLEATRAWVGECRFRQQVLSSWGRRMRKAYLKLAGISMFGLASIAHAGAPVQLTDWQMDVVTAGNAKAITAFQTTAAGQHTAIQTMVGNVAADRPTGSLAQSRTAVLATSTGRASVTTDVINQSSADGHGPTQVATASTAGSASGDSATVRSANITTAISASIGPGRNSIGIADSLANVIAFSVSGRSR